MFDLNARLCDFGLARQKLTDSTTLGAVINLAGTPAYIAPEVHLDERAAQYYSDIWSLGMTTVEWLTSKRAWDLDPDDEDYRYNIKKKKQDKCMPEGLARVPAVVRGVLTSSLSYDTKARPTAAEMMKFLSDISSRLSPDNSCFSDFCIKCISTSG